MNRSISQQWRRMFVAAAIVAASGTVAMAVEEAPPSTSSCDNPTGWRDCWMCYRGLLRECAPEQTPELRQNCYDGARVILSWCLNELRRPQQQEQGRTGIEAIELIPAEPSPGEPVGAAWNPSQPLAIDITNKANTEHAFFVLDESGELRPIEPLMLHFNDDGSTTAFLDPADGDVAASATVRAVIVQSLDPASGDLLDADAIVVVVKDPLDADGDGTVTKNDLGAAVDAFTSGQWGVAEMSGWIADYLRRAP